MRVQATTKLPFRKLIGRTAELAGTSNTTNLSVVQNGPLPPASPTNSGSSAITSAAMGRTVVI